MKVLDDRRPPFCWASNDVIAILQEALAGRELNTTLGLYQAFSYLASSCRDGDHEGFEKTRTEVAKACGLSTRRLKEPIDRLIELQLLEVEVGGGSRPNTWRLIDPPLRLTPPAKASGGTDRRGVDVSSGGPPDAASGATKKTGRREEAPPISPPQPEKQVFDAWCSAMRRNGRTRLNGKRRSKIRARLREGYSVEELIAAVRGAKRDDWIMGRDPQSPGYTDLVTILRDGAQVERLAALDKPERKRRRRSVPERAKELVAMGVDEDSARAQAEYEAGR